MNEQMNLNDELGRTCEKSGDILHQYLQGWIEKNKIPPRIQDRIAEHYTSPW
jgi:hypothetical protein